MKLIILSHENLDLDLIKEVYYNLLIPAFPNKDHIEPYQDFLSAFDNRNVFEYKKKVFVFIEDEKAIASMTVEYYPLSNFINMPYIVVDSKFRGKKLSRLLFEEGFKELELQSQMRLEAINNNPKDERIPELTKFFNFTKEEETWELLKTLPPHYCLEAEFETEYDPVMNATDRLHVYDKLGFKIINFKYIQPPLTEFREPVSKLYLLTATKFCLKDKDGNYFMKSASLKTFMWEFSHILSLKFLKSKQFEESIKSLSEENVFLRMIKF